MITRLFTLFFITILFACIVILPNSLVHSKEENQILNHNLTEYAIILKDASLCEQIRSPIGAETMENCYQRFLQFALTSKDCNSLPAEYVDNCTDHLNDIRITKLSSTDLGTPPRYWWEKQLSIAPKRVTEYCIDTNRNGKCEYINFSVDVDSAISEHYYFTFDLTKTKPIYGTMLLNMTVEAGMNTLSFLASSEAELADEGDSPSSGVFKIFRYSDYASELSWYDFYSTNHFRNGQSRVEPRIPQILAVDSNTSNGILPIKTLNFEQNFYLVLLFVFASLITIYVIEIWIQKISLRTYLGRRITWMAQPSSIFGVKCFRFQQIFGSVYAVMAMLLVWILLVQNASYDVEHQFGEFGLHTFIYGFAAIALVSTLAIIIGTYIYSRRQGALLSFILANGAVFISSFFAIGLWALMLTMYFTIVMGTFAILCFADVPFRYLFRVLRSRK